MKKLFLLLLSAGLLQAEAYYMKNPAMAELEKNCKFNIPAVGKCLSERITSENVCIEKKKIDRHAKFKSYGRTIYSKCGISKKCVLAFSHLGTSMAELFTDFAKFNPYAGFMLDFSRYINLYGAPSHCSARGRLGLKSCPAGLSVSKNCVAEKALKNIGGGEMRRNYKMRGGDYRCIDLDVEVGFKGYVPFVASHIDRVLDLCLNIENFPRNKRCYTNFKTYRDILWANRFIGDKLLKKSHQCLRKSSMMRPMT